MQGTLCGKSLPWLGIEICGSKNLFIAILHIVCIFVSMNQNKYGVFCSKIGFGTLPYRIDPFSDPAFHNVLCLWHTNLKCKITKANSNKLSTNNMAK